jgi:hypothetical protein
MDIRLLRIAGGINAAAAALHCGFPWTYDWSTTLDPLSDFNRGVMLVLNIAVTYVLFGFSAVTLWRPADLLALPIGRAVAWVIAGFWLVRAVDEFFVFSSPSPVMAVIYAAVALLYAVPLLRAHRRRPAYPSDNTPGFPLN